MKIPQNETLLSVILKINRIFLNINEENPPLNTTIYWSNWNKPTCIDSSVKVWSSSLNLFLSLSTPQDPKERLGCHPQTGFADITGHPFFRNVDWDLVSVFSVVLKGGRPGLLLTVKYSRIYGFPESLRSIFLFTTSCAESESGRRVNVSQPAVIFTSVVWQQLGRDRRDLFSQRALGEGQLVTVSGQISLPPPPPHTQSLSCSAAPGLQGEQLGSEQLIQVQWWRRFWTHDGFDLFLWCKN